MLGAAFPEREIEGIALGLVRFDAHADLQILDLALRELAVGRKRSDGVVDALRPIRLIDHVGGALLDEALDERDDLGDVLADFGLDVGLQAAERADVLLIEDGHPRGERQRLFADLGGPPMAPNYAGAEPSRAETR